MPCIAPAIPLHSAKAHNTTVLLYYDGIPNVSIPTVVLVGDTTPRTRTTIETTMMYFDIDIKALQLIEYMHQDVTEIVYPPSQNIIVNQTVIHFLKIFSIRNIQR
jgi:hypothetical protein